MPSSPSLSVQLSRALRPCETEALAPLTDPRPHPSPDFLPLGHDSSRDLVAGGSHGICLSLGAYLTTASRSTGKPPFAHPSSPHGRWGWSTLYHRQQRCDDPGLHAHLTALPSVLRVHPQKWPFRVAGHSAARGVRLSQRLPRLTPPPAVRGAPASPHPRQYLLFSAVLRGSILVGEG